jgi:hypothetical protein
MRGHIRERSPGQWAIVLDIRDPATGKRRRKWHSFSGTKRGAEIERSRLVTAISGRRVSRAVEADALCVSRSMADAYSFAGSTAHLRALRRISPEEYRAPARASRVDETETGANLRSICKSAH